jgi:RNA polymerase sigma-70 factor (ECF subfamily)
LNRPPEGVARWLPAARAGSQEALGRLLEACRGYLLMIARDELDPRLSAKGSASDLVQETFLEAQRDFAQFHGSTTEEVLAWLRRLLLNNLVNFSRRFRQTGKREVSREVSLDAGEPGGRLREFLTADTPAPVRLVAEREQAEVVWRSLERLPADYRRVLLLRHREGRSFEQIARVMGRSLNAVHKLWVRAVERIRREVEVSHESE